jgi:hypothetical protein
MASWLLFQYAVLEKVLFPYQPFFILSTRIVLINKLCNVASCLIYEYIGILLGAHPILHISRIKVKQDRQCAYNVIIEACSCNRWCSGKAISISFWVCVCSLTYPDCNTHAQYCRLWPASLDNILPHYLINCTNIERKTKLLNVKFVFWYPQQLCQKYVSF